LAGIELAKELEEVLTAYAVAQRKLGILKDQMQRVIEARLVAARRVIPRIERQIAEAEEAMQKWREEIEKLDSAPFIPINIRILDPPTLGEPAKKEEAPPQ
jgi:chromosome segregation ATPase